MTARATKRSDAPDELSANAKSLGRGRFKNKRVTLGLLRTALGLSQEQIAKALEVSQAQVSRIENAIDDGDPQLSSLVRYAKALGGDVEISVRIDGQAYRVR